MEKVKLSRKMAEAIETIVKEGVSASDIIHDHVISLHDGKPWVRFPELNDISVDTLILALYIGYEVEQTPEDKVREYFNKVMNSKSPLPHIAVIDTLDILGIKIEGVNT